MSSQTPYYKKLKTINFEWIPNHVIKSCLKLSSLNFYDVFKNQGFFIRNNNTRVIKCISKLSRHMASHLKPYDLSTI